MALTPEERESILRHIPAIADGARGFVAQVMPRWFDEIVAGTESPIEALFMLTWRSIFPLIDSAGLVELHPQFGFAPIDGRNYRADFVIWPSDLDVMAKANALGIVFTPIIIELDGHDYHERTKEQVIARNQRDRDFQSKGYTVLHFSGSEMHRDPMNVVLQVAAVVRAEWEKYNVACRSAGLWMPRRPILA